MKTLPTPVLPSSLEIIDGIEVKDNRYNGYSTLLDAFLALLPDSVKRPEYDGRIERLYHEVKRALFAPTRSTFLESKEHWALLG